MPVHGARVNVPRAPNPARRRTLRRAPLRARTVASRVPNRSPPHADPVCVSPPPAPKALFFPLVGLPPRTSLPSSPPDAHARIHANRTAIPPSVAKGPRPSAPSVSNRPPTGPLGRTGRGNVPGGKRARACRAPGLGLKVSASCARGTTSRRLSAVPRSDL